MSVVDYGGRLVKDTYLLRLNEASCCLLSEWLPGGSELVAREIGGHWLRMHSRSKEQSCRW